jgi:ABC-type multidrug transport system ATPase subunit
LEAILIEVEHLTKSYGQARAVHDISFQVAKGEILGFLGPNGAGKTTTMRILAGFLPATSGTARVCGFDVFEKSLEVRKRIGYLPETPPLYPEMAVEDYLIFVSRIKGVPSSEVSKRVTDAMGMTSITDKRREYIKRLSRGYKQRVGIAQAIVHNPDVVILDEPTVGLDPNQIKEVRNLIKGLSGEHTIILSTHILPEVEMTCDRVVIINKGKIAAVDTTGNLTNQLKAGELVKLSVKRLERNGDELAGKLKKSLETIDGVNQVKIEGNENDTQVSALVEIAQGLDLRAPIAARVVHHGFDLLELRAINLSLEDIFMQLTTEEKIEVKTEEKSKEKTEEKTEVKTEETTTTAKT